MVFLEGAIHWFEVIWLKKNNIKTNCYNQFKVITCIVERGDFDISFRHTSCEGIMTPKRYQTLTQTEHKQRSRITNHYKKKCVKPSDIPSDDTIKGGKITSPDGTWLTIPDRRDYHNGYYECDFVTTMVNSKISPPPECEEGFPQKHRKWLLFKIYTAIR